MDRAMILCILLSALTFSGCVGGSNRIISSIDDLTSDYEYKGLLIRQGSQLSIPGHITADGIGQLYFNKAKRGPYNAIGITCKNKSFYMTKTFNNNVTLQDLIDIRDKIVDLQTTASKLVDNRLSILKDDLLKIKNATKGMSNDDRKKLEVDYNKNKKDFYEIEKKVLKSIKKQGVMIFRWNVEDEKGASSNISQSGAKMAAIDYRKSIGKNGFALVGGIRICNLYIGTDLLNAWKGVREFGGFNDQLIIPTTLLQAKNIIYLSSQDISKYVNAQFSFTKEQFAKILGTPEGIYKLLLDQTALEVTTYMARVENISNTGIMGKMDSEFISINLGDVPKAKITDGWTTFYQVSTGLKRLKAFIYTKGLETVIEEAAGLESKK